jgi:hypothetical protein
LNPPEAINKWRDYSSDTLHRQAINEVFAALTNKLTGLKKEQAAPPSAWLSGPFFACEFLPTFGSC